MSYFPSDIPYMTNEEMEEHGINAKRERGMNTDKLWTAISGIERQLNNLKGELIDIDEETKQSVDEAYQRGLDDAWEAARKICLGKEDGGISNGELLEIFKVGSDYTALKKYSASEVIEKLKAYEEKQKADDEIKVGGERMKAKIVKNEDCAFLYWTCSNCNSLVLEHDNFCSNCGADFRRNEEGEEKDNDGN